MGVEHVLARRAIVSCHACAGVCETEVTLGWIEPTPRTKNNSHGTSCVMVLLCAAVRDRDWSDAELHRKHSVVESL
jgi:hypothetical protein